MDWREQRERWKKARRRVLTAEVAAGGVSASEVDDRNWHAFGMPAELSRRLAELRVQLAGHEAASVLLEENIRRVGPLGRRKWAVSGFGRGWGTRVLGRVDRIGGPAGHETGGD